MSKPPPRLVAEDVVDEAGVARREADDADRDVLAERHVDDARDLVALVAVVHGVGVERDVRLEAGRIRLVRDVTQRPGLRARAVQRALRPGQRLDALDVDEADLGLQRALRQRLLVEVDGGGSVGDEGRRVVRDAAKIDRAASRRPWRCT